MSFCVETGEKNFNTLCFFVFFVRESLYFQFLGPVVVQNNIFPQAQWTRICIWFEEKLAAPCSRSSKCALPSKRDSVLVQQDCSKANYLRPMRRKRFFRLIRPKCHFFIFFLFFFFRCTSPLTEMCLRAVLSQWHTRTLPLISLITTHCIYWNRKRKKKAGFTVQRNNSSIGSMTKSPNQTPFDVLASTCADHKHKWTIKKNAITSNVCVVCKTKVKASIRKRRR